MIEIYGKYCYDSGSDVYFFVVLPFTGDYQLVYENVHSESGIDTWVSLGLSFLKNVILWC